MELGLAGIRSAEVVVVAAAAVADGATAMDLDFEAPIIISQAECQRFTSIIPWCFGHDRVHTPESLEIVHGEIETTV